MTNLVVISDLHCGSTVALMPQKFQTIEGQVVLANRFQEWLLSCWNDAIAKLPGEYILLLNGDIVEGVHHGTTQVISPDVADHIEAAKLMLAPVVEKATAVHVTLGTECHTRTVESALGKMFQASRCEETGKYAHSHLLFRVEDQLVSATHHCSATSRVWLESGEYSRAMAHERLECSRVGWEIPTVFFRAHRHRLGYFCDGAGIIGITGAWQGLTRHGHKAVAGSLPTPSIIHAVFDGGLPVFHQHVYTPPQRTIL